MHCSWLQLTPSRKLVPFSKFCTRKSCLQPISGQINLQSPFKQLLMHMGNQSYSGILRSYLSDIISFVVGGLISCTRKNISLSLYGHKEKINIYSNIVHSFHIKWVSNLLLLQCCQIPRSKSWSIYCCHVPISVCGYVWWLGAWHMHPSGNFIFNIQGEEILKSGN